MKILERFFHIHEWKYYHPSGKPIEDLLTIFIEYDPIEQTFELETSYMKRKCVKCGKVQTFLSKSDGFAKDEWI